MLGNNRARLKQQLDDHKRNAENEVRKFNANFGTNMDAFRRILAQYLNQADTTTEQQRQTIINNSTKIMSRLNFVFQRQIEQGNTSPEVLETYNHIRHVLPVLSSVHSTASEKSVNAFKTALDINLNIAVGNQISETRPVITSGTTSTVTSGTTSTVTSGTTSTVTSGTTSTVTSAATSTVTSGTTSTVTSGTTSTVTRGTTSTVTSDATSTVTSGTTSTVTSGTTSTFTSGTTSTVTSAATSTVTSGTTSTVTSGTTSTVTSGTTSTVTSGTTTKTSEFCQDNFPTEEFRNLCNEKKCENFIGMPCKILQAREIQFQKIFNMDQYKNPEDPNFKTDFQNCQKRPQLCLDEAWLRKYLKPKSPPLPRTFYEDESIYSENSKTLLKDIQNHTTNNDLKNVVERIGGYMAPITISEIGPFVNNLIHDRTIITDMDSFPSQDDVINRLTQTLDYYVDSVRQNCKTLDNQTCQDYYNCKEECDAARKQPKTKAETNPLKGIKIVHKESKPKTEEEKAEDEAFELESARLLAEEKKRDEKLGAAADIALQAKKEAEQKVMEERKEQQQKIQAYCNEHFTYAWYKSKCEKKCMDENSESCVTLQSDEQKLKTLLETKDSNYKEPHTELGDARKNCETMSFEQCKYSLNKFLKPDFQTWSDEELQSVPTQEVLDALTSLKNSPYKEFAHNIQPHIEHVPKTYGQVGPMLNELFKTIDVVNNAHEQELKQNPPGEHTSALETLLDKLDLYMKFFVQRLAEKCKDKDYCKEAFQCNQPCYARVETEKTNLAKAKEEQVQAFENTLGKLRKQVESELDDGDEEDESGSYFD